MKKLIWAASGLLVGLICAGIIAEVQASRNSAGTYSIPSTFVSGTTISSSAVNGNFSDIGSELTNSLERNGKGGMLAALRGIDGTLAAPAFSWTSETGSGLWRNAAGDVRMSILGALVGQWTANGLRVASGAVATPGLSFTSDTGAGLYRIGSNDIGFAINGAKVQEWTATGVTVTGSAADQTVASFLNGSRAPIGIVSTATQPAISSNATNTAGSWTYATSQAALALNMEVGTPAYIFYTAPAGTAGNAVTFTERARVGTTGLTVGASGTATARINFGTGTFNAGTPAQFTATVGSGATCFANRIGASTVNNLSVEVSVTGTTLTVTSAFNGDSSTANWICF